MDPIAAIAEKKLPTIKNNLVYPSLCRLYPWHLVLVGEGLLVGSCDSSFVQPT
ncbi:MAG: hypothetical protein NC828_02580 [Candidatus Omnitrophica bacterium]|nr:hypothetical protein [Candidatus Omnitrophota bacterium]